MDDNILAKKRRFQEMAENGPKETCALCKEPVPIHLLYKHTRDCLFAMEEMMGIAHVCYCAKKQQNQDEEPVTPTENISTPTTTTLQSPLHVEKYWNESLEKFRKGKEKQRHCIVPPNVCKTVFNSPSNVKIYIGEKVFVVCRVTQFSQKAVSEYIEELLKKEELKEGEKRMQILQERKTYHPICFWEGYTT